MDVDRLIKPHNPIATLLYPKGKTKDIVRVVLKTLDENASDTKKLAPMFSADLAGMKKIWNLVKDNIQYEEDPDGFQWIQTPSYLWHTKVGDCKSFTVFIASILHNLGVPHWIQFVSYNYNDRLVTHVYPIAIIDKKEVILDAVYQFFNKEKPFYYGMEYTEKRFIR